MAMTMPSGNGGKGRNRRSFRPVSDINVTPLVDVMLVLLIVFMVTAPLMTVGVPVDLPSSNAPVLNEQEEPLTVSINKEGKIYLQETELDLEALVPRLVAITKSNPEARIYVRGDQALMYGKIMEIMGAINAAGFVKVALIAEMPSSTPAPKKAGALPVP